MERIISILIVFSLIITGCKNKADKLAPQKDSLISTSTYSWESVINDSSGRLEMKKREDAGPDSLTSMAVINFLNQTHPDIKLEFLKQSNDTIYIEIPDAEHLTQRMGSTGPTMYFAGAVYNLTEIPGVKYVNFDFDEGDHASPGTYSRESFKDE